MLECWGSEAWLGWFGHVERNSKDEAFEGILRSRGVEGRPRKTWGVSFNEGMGVFGLKPEQAHDREEWLFGIVD